MILQVYHDIKKINQKLQINLTPDLSLIRPALFWDTTLDKIDWTKQKLSVIERVLGRGNEQEKNEIVRFYGKETVDKVMKRIATGQH